MKKIFLVTNGSPPDHRVTAAFSTQEKARRFVHYYTQQEDSQIVELQVDEFDPDRPELYRVRVTTRRDGQLNETPEKYIRTQLPTQGMPWPRFLADPEVLHPRERYPYLLVTVANTNNIDQAIAEAQEWRTQVENAGLWPEVAPENLNRDWGPLALSYQNIANDRLLRHLEATQNKRSDSTRSTETNDPSP